MSSALPQCTVGRGTMVEMAGLITLNYLVWLIAQVRSTNIGPVLLPKPPRPFRRKGTSDRQFGARVERVYFVIPNGASNEISNGISCRN